MEGQENVRGDTEMEIPEGVQGNASREVQEDVFAQEDVLKVWSSLDNPNLKESRLAPLNSLCSGCFGLPQADLGFICFDGNFQHKRMKDRNQNTPKNQDYGGKQLFVDTPLPSTEAIYQKVYRPKLRLISEHCSQ
jgi:hypothetical protein